MRPMLLFFAKVVAIPTALTVLLLLLRLAGLHLSWWVVLTPLGIGLWLVVLIYAGLSRLSGAWGRWNR